MILLLQLNGFSTVDGLVSPSKPRIFNTLQVIMLPEVVDHLGFSSLAYKSSTLVFRMAVDSMLDASGTSTITLDKNLRAPVSQAYLGRWKMNRVRQSPSNPTLLVPWQMTLPISVEDVKREVKILRTLSGHENVVQFYASFEDDDLVYIVME
jgi:hypothetical protein